MLGAQEPLVHPYCCGMAHLVELKAQGERDRERHCSMRSSSNWHGQRCQGTRRSVNLAVFLVETSDDYIHTLDSVTCMSCFFRLLGPSFPLFSRSYPFVLRHSSTEAPFIGSTLNRGLGHLFFLSCFLRN